MDLWYTLNFEGRQDRHGCPGILSGTTNALNGAELDEHIARWIKQGIPASAITIKVEPWAQPKP